MANLWIVVADAVEARTYERHDDKAQLRPDRRLESLALRVFEQGEELPPFWVRWFARDLSALLEYAAACSEYDQLILAGPDQFLQILTNAMGPAAHKRLRRTFIEEVTKLNAADLEARLSEIIRSAN